MKLDSHCNLSNFRNVSNTRALVSFCFSRTALEKWRHSSHYDPAINPEFKCDECSYMTISQTVLKHCTTMKHTNKDEPDAFGKKILFKIPLSSSIPLTKKQIIQIKHIKKIYSLKKSISSAIVELAISCVNFKAYWFSIWRKSIILVNFCQLYSA